MSTSHGRPTLLSWINAEVDQALLLVRDHDRQVLGRARGRRRRCASCPEHLHQVSGALRMVGPGGRDAVLRGDRGQLRRPERRAPNATAVGVIDRAVLALKEFVDDLARGQADVPLRLYPVYRELAQLQGSERRLGEGPVLPGPVAQGAAAPRSRRRSPPDKLAAHVQKQRALFQRGLLAWLRKPPAAASTRCAAPSTSCTRSRRSCPSRSGIWWVGARLPRRARAVRRTRNGSPRPRRSATRSSARCATGARRQCSEALLRELLYAIAKCQPVDAAHEGNPQPLPARQPVPERRSAGAGVMEFDIELARSRRSTTCIRASMR